VPACGSVGGARDGVVTDHGGRGTGGFSDGGDGGAEAAETRDAGSDIAGDGGEAAETRDVASDAAGDGAEAAETRDAGSDAAGDGAEAAETRDAGSDAAGDGGEATETRDVASDAAGDDAEATRDVASDVISDGGGGETDAEDAPPSDGPREAADPIVRDQFNPSTGGIVGLQPDQFPGQSFTVGRAGRLQGIALPMFRYGPAAAGDRIALTLNLCSAIATCDSTALATATIAADSLPTTFPSTPPPLFGIGYFDLSASGVRVSAGEIYRVMLVPPTGTQTFGVLDSLGDAYPGGVVFSQLGPTGGIVVLDRSLDLAFATYVAD
jgi:hypothetical protein